MRALLIVFLLGTGLGLHNTSQTTDTHPDWLPDEPLMQVGYWMDTPRIVWLNENTLILEAEEFSPDSRVVTYQYDVTSDKLEILENPLLRLDLTPELIEHYQSLAGEPIYRSPFSVGNYVPVVYHIRLYVVCGRECNGQLVMLGEFTEAADDVTAPGMYRPLPNIYAQCGVQVNWTHADVAVIQIEGCYGFGSSLVYMRLRGSHLANSFPLFVGAVDDFEQHLLAISDDGNRVLFDSFSSTTEPLIESLYYWQAKQISEVDPLPTVERTIEIGARNSSLYPFAAANFIRGNNIDILAVHTDDIVRINLDSDVREVLNSEINANWMRLGYFSPDNRHLAAITWDGELYVIETGVGE